MKKISIAFALFNVFSLQASLVAIIDSGLDVEHHQLSSYIWVNQLEHDGIEGVDDDGNGLVDDINGWDFESNSAVLIDPDKKDSFTEDTADYFELQYRVEMTKLGVPMASATEVELFARDPRSSLAYEFGHLAHGTHVAGIVAQQNGSVSLMGIKKADTSVSLGPYLADLKQYKVNRVAHADAEGLRRTAKYLNQFAVRVANGSFGTPYEAVINRFYSALHSQQMGLAEVKYISSLYQQQTLIEQKKALELSPQTLFVFAAGNSGYDNDKFIFTPANIVADNSITVAATAGRDYLPVFSCFGEKTVHVAAPGVGIVSTVPGDHEMHMTGTSQAAPFVTRVASKIVDVNASLSPKQIKEIIMGTVDKKSFLVGKVATGGIVNEERSLYAAELSLKMNVDAAIRLSRISIPDAR